MKAKKSYSDSELLRALQTTESDEAIRQLYRSNFNIVSIYIKNNKGNDEDAEDIFQNIIITFMQIVKENKFRGESSINTFIYSLARHAWLNELKRRGRAQLREEKFEKEIERIEPDISQYLISNEIKERIQQLLDNIGETCKKILLAFYYDELAIKEILELLDYENEQVVRNKKYKCLKQLEQVLFSSPETAQTLKSAILYER